MNKTELVSAIVAELEENFELKATKKETTAQLEALVNVVVASVAAGEDVKIPGFGTFGVTERAAREGRNPQTGETIQIEASKSPKFKAAKAFKDAVKEA